MKKTGNVLVFCAQGSENVLEYLNYLILKKTRLFSSKTRTFADSKIPIARNDIVLII